jgi:tRNA threonylcarbamoyl adenosine modification protein YeaZ
MRLLAWDTSSKTGTIAALLWDAKSKGTDQNFKVLSEWRLNVDLAHSDQLLWALSQTLEAANWKLPDIDYLGVGVGPGSFTGLRVGLATAKALAFSLSRPIVGVSSLAAYARPVADWAYAFRRKILVIVAHDACKNEVYALWGAARSVRECVALAENDLPGVWKRGVEEKALSPTVLASALRKKYAEGMDGWIALGNAVDRYPEIFSALPRETRIEVPHLTDQGVDPRTLGQLAWEGVQAGLPRAAELVGPRYLRASEAEMKLKAGLLPKGPRRG